MQICRDTLIVFLHSGLMNKITKHISDKSLLKLLKRMLKTPIAETTARGKIKIIANRVGTPQGSSLSPLFANIYLNDFCKYIHDKTPCKIISYADDFVILHKRAFTTKQLNWVESILAKGGLVLNRTKTQCVNMLQQGNEFDFLGLRYKRVRGFYRNTQYIKVEPSKNKSSQIQR